MIYILYGPNSYHRQQKLLQIQEAAVAKNNQSTLERFSLSDSGGVHAALEAFLSRDLFSAASKIVVISDLKECDDVQALERLCEIAQKQKDALLIIYEDWSKKELPKDAKTIGALSDAKKMFFPELNKQQQLQAARDEVARRKISLSADVLKMIVEAAPDMWGVVHELDRLSLLGVPLTKEVLAQYGAYRASVSMYELSQALLGSSLGNRLMGVEQFFAQSGDAYMAFAYLAKMAKGKEAAQKIAQADIAIKSGRLEIGQALTLLALG